MAPSPLVLGYGSVHPFSQIPITDRSSVQDLVKTLLDPLEPHFSPLKARVRVPGGTAVRFDNTAAEIEGICRPMWALGSLLAGGATYRGTEWWVQGLKSGTDPESEEYWGDPRDNDQRMVEMCPLGFMLAVAPVFWESLSERERGNVETWLGNSINSKKYVLCISAYGPRSTDAFYANGLQHAKYKLALVQGLCQSWPEEEWREVLPREN
jgi:hypothetical protein